LKKDSLKENRMIQMFPTNSKNLLKVMTKDLLLLENVLEINQLGLSDIFLMRDQFMKESLIRLGKDKDGVLPIEEEM